MKSIVVLFALVAVAFGASTQLCTDFCTSYLAECVNDYPIFSDAPSCMAECASWVEDPNCPTGDIDTPTDCVGNTYGCRLYHLNAAVALDDRAFHCPHATSLSARTSDFSATPAVEGQCTTASDAALHIVQNSYVEDFCNHLISTCASAVTSDLASCLAIYQHVPGARDVSDYPDGETTFFPVSNAAASGTPADLPCRRYHVAVAAADAASATTHCPHAAFGADQCGSDCAFFCALVGGACPGALAPYTNAGACQTACAAMTAIDYTAALPTSGDTLGCRLYHATVAARSDDLASVHCPHTSALSTEATCGAQPDGAVAVSANLALVALLAAFALL